MIAVLYWTPLVHRYYDIVVGDGAEAKVGARVAVHYDVK